MVRGELAAVPLNEAGPCSHKEEEMPNDITLTIRSKRTQTPDHSVVTPLTPWAPGYVKTVSTDRIREALEASGKKVGSIQRS